MVKVLIGDLARLEGRQELLVGRGQDGCSL
jgi:hypothetical protein